jgi:beta-glucosidase
MGIRTVPGIWGALDTGERLTAEQIESRARELLGRMTLDEKIRQMSGDMPTARGLLSMMRQYNPVPYPAGENERLGIPGIRFSDGPRGVVIYHSTCFPVSMARGASWDTTLEERIGDAIGIEARSQGANFFGGVCINLLRHPAWGRAQETYGEDPHHVGEMGVALTRGVQRHIMACAKHYACNSIENSRMRLDVRVGERALHEVYLPHFKRLADEGVAAVMSAYNKVNGTHCGHNRYLLIDTLKQAWGFHGFVISDFVFGIRSPLAAASGLDIEMPATVHFGRRLKRAVRRGRVPLAAVDEAVLRILRTKLRFAAGPTGPIGEPERYGAEAVVSADHVALAREAAVKSMVLLKNEPLDSGRPVLPLDLGTLGRIAVVGRLAAVANTGDRGSSDVRPPYVVTPLQGMRAAVGEWASLTFDGGSDLAAAARTASKADVAIVVAGYDHQDEGEYIDVPLGSRGGDRRHLTLLPQDERLIQAVAAANPRTVVVLLGGSAIITEAWRQKVPAILMAWYAGMEGGHALADILFGKANPGGKLPCVWPRAAEHLPFFDPDVDEIEYGLFHGYRLLDRQGHEPAFAFGFGLSYTTFECSNLQLSDETIAPEGCLVVSVDVTNTGQRVGDQVVQLYVGCEGSRVERAPRSLVAFDRIGLEPGEKRTVRLELPVRRLAYYDVALAGWVVEPISYVAYVGSSSRSQDLLAARFRVRA